MSIRSKTNAAEVKTLAARREQKKRQDKVIQDANQVQNEVGECMEVPISVDETKELESIAEQPLDEVEPMKLGMFTVKPFNKVLENAVKKGELEHLYDEFWFEGETCCLFGDSNVGKSILAVQIARDIANKGKKVLYFDFELSESQILRRYSDSETKKCYNFSENLFHVSLNHMMNAYSVEELPREIIKQMGTLVKETAASVVIVDNLTWIAYNSGSGKMAGEAIVRIF